jgi:hypothetical protein
MPVTLDFTALDMIQGDIQLEHEPAQTMSIQPQTTTPPTATVRQHMRAVSIGLKQGKDPYPLLLGAIQAISILTGEPTYYTAHRDIMQGMGQLDGMPAEWLKEARERDLVKLEQAKVAIDTAILFHKKRLL